MKVLTVATSNNPDDFYRTVREFTLGNLRPAYQPGAVGEVAPDFTLEDHNGQKVALSDARGKSPVVLVFYRGYW